MKYILQYYQVEPHTQNYQNPFAPPTKTLFFSNVQSSYNSILSLYFVYECLFLFEHSTITKNIWQNDKNVFSFLNSFQIVLRCFFPCFQFTWNSYRSSVSCIVCCICYCIFSISITVLFNASDFSVFEGGVTV